MYDAVTAAHIPAVATMVGGYIDGRYKWSPQDWARFPHSTHVRIAVFASTDDGHVLDVEYQDATPQQAPGWVTRRRAAGADPSIYCDAADWPAVRAAFARAKVREPHYWIAAHPGAGPVVPPGAVAHQYADTGLFDLSVVNDYWPGVDPVPPRPPISKEPPTTMPKAALPAGAYPVKDAGAVWKPDGSQLDWFLLGADGHLYHYWWQVVPGVWTGPELVDGPG